MFFYKGFEVKVVSSDKSNYSHMIVGYSDNKHYGVYGHSVLETMDNFREHIDFLEASM